MNQAANTAAKLAAYVQLLARYNGSLNLLSDKGLHDVDRLLADGAAYAEAVEALAGTTATVVDVGSGAGFPGIVIAATLSDARVYLVERRRRRAAFLELAARSCGLTNVTVVAHDVRRLTGVCAQVVTAQAVTTLADLTQLTRHLHEDPCFLISRRGPGWQEELPAVSGVLDGDTRASSSATDRDTRQSSSGAEEGSAVAVVVDKDLEQSGSLVALRLTGGPACRSSG